jgi:tetratricopeptide (TPR) repeat protein
VLAETLIRLGDHAGAAHVAGDIPALFPGDGQADAQALDIVAACPALADKDPKLSADQRRGLIRDYVEEVGRLTREFARHSAKDAEALSALAAFLADHADERVRDPARAVRHAEEAVRLANGWSTLALARYRAGRWQAASEALDKAMQLRRPQVGIEDVLLHTMVRWRLADKTRARQLYEQAAAWIDQNDPRNEDLLRRRRAEAASLLGVALPTKPASGAGSSAK